ncbi:MAG: alpha-amylase [Chitinophagia bacterium]|nr:alpha-amylase [Chitinophagia bacterium]
MKLKILLTLSWVTCFTSVFSATNIDVYPTHWWVGMKNPNLQLMVHGEQELSKGKISVSHPGLLVKAVHQPENKHYLFVDLQISSTVRPGKYTLKLSDGTLFTYELKARKTDKNIHQGVRSNDLIYLIMPDRFANGDNSNDAYADLRDKDTDRTNPYVRHGGDLKGISNRLDYLKDLGVTSIWMTPILENDMPKMQEGPWTMSGYHGYWITNHYKIDKRFGGNEAYKELVSAAHSKGIKIIQDAVYNHVGSYHHTVLDPPMKEWLNQWPQYTGSNHREELFTDPYASTLEKKIMIGGWFVPHLPDLNLSNPFCANFVIQSNIWSTEEFGIDGWRVDTYKYCDEKFLNDINAALVKEFPNITVFGEAWTNTVPASAYFTQNNINAPFKHQIKGVTDFPLSNAIYDALNQPYGWNEGVSRLYTTLSQDFLYKDPMTNCIFLDNHDMNRFFSMVGEDMDKYKMGLGLLLTTRGIPQVYYGTEILMKNYKDPNDAAVRKDFPGGWSSDPVGKFDPGTLNTKEKEAFDFFRKLAQFRKNSPAIANGKLKQFIPANGVYVYFRIHQNQKLMCILNTNTSNSNLGLEKYQEELSTARALKNVLTGELMKTPNSLHLSGKSFQIFEVN